MRPWSSRVARDDLLRASTRGWLPLVALALGALALLGLLGLAWPRALPLVQAAAEPTEPTEPATRATPAPPRHALGACESTHAESEPSCVHPRGREVHAGP